MKILLFDIDGTLILSGGAGLRAMTTAFEDIFSVADAFQGVNMSGRTDASIVKDAMVRHGVKFSRQKLLQFKSHYMENLLVEIEKPGNKKQTMPGIVDLLKTLEKTPGIYMGLLTGNWEKSGRIKLEHFDLSDYFGFGAFSDDSSVRDELLPFAMKRFKEKYKFEPNPNDVYIIGDTPADINCAKPHGVKSVGVAAAFYTVEQLEPYKPDYLFNNLKNTQEFLDILELPVKNSV